MYLLMKWVSQIIALQVGLYDGGPDVITDNTLPLPLPYILIKRYKTVEKWDIPRWNLPLESSDEPARGEIKTLNHSSIEQ